MHWQRMLSGLPLHQKQEPWLLEIPSLAAASQHDIGHAPRTPLPPVYPLAYKQLVSVSLPCLTDIEIAHKHVCRLASSV